MAAMLMATRVVFWLQGLLGLWLAISRLVLGSRPLGVASGEGDMHMLLGIVGAVLAIVVFRPGSAAPSNGLTTAAAFFPLVPLLLGFMIRFGGMGSVAFTLVHAVVAIASIGLIEAASARRRRMVVAAAAPPPA
jgi:hypothetical protein